MKKLITLLLVLTGAVCSANAESITRRIYIEIQGDLATNWSWKNQAPVVWVGSSENDVATTLKKDTYTRESRSNKLYYADITGEDLSDLSLIITSGENTNDQWHAVTVDDVDLTNTNKIFYIYVEDNACKASVGDFGYKFTYWEDGGSHNYVDLSYDGNQLIGTYTNSGVKYALVFPSLVTTGGPFGDYIWEFAHRPNSYGNYLVDAFKFYTDDFNGTYDSQAFKFTEDMSYDLSFSIAPSEKFSITPYFTTTIADASGYATFSNDEKCTISGAELYVVNENNDSYVRLSQKDNATVWPEKEGVILKGAQNDEVTISAVAADATASTIGANYLVGIGNAAETVTATDDTYVFASDGAGGVGFYKASGSGELAAHKAYLDLSRSSFKAREFLAFSFDDEVTGIGATLMNSEKVNSEVYNLNGQRVAQPTKGLYIMNGKKVIVK